MKKLPTVRRASLVLLLVLLGIPAALVGALAIPTPPSRGAAEPALESSCRGDGPFAAGAAAVEFQLPPGAPLGGFARRDYASEGTRDPVGARALVLRSGECRVALVSAEVVLVPGSLEVAVRARLGDVPLDGLVIAATHTHAGPGGYWEHALGERLGVGPFDPAVRDAIAGAIADAIRRAARDAAPARLALARARVEKLARNRAGTETVDGRLVVLRLGRPDGEPVAEVVLYPAHPTLLGKQNRLLSGDWPGRFLGVRSHGVRLFFQGAGGDQSVRLPTPGPVSPEVYAAALSTEVDRLAIGAPDGAPQLGWARATLRLPPPSPGAVPGWLARPARNASWSQLPGEAHVAALRLGPVLLAIVPGEPTAAVGAALRAAAGPGAEVLSLAGGYCGYVEDPAVMAARRGETHRTYYGPELAPRVVGAVEQVAAAARGAPRAGLAPRGTPARAAQRR